MRSLFFKIFFSFWLAMVTIGIVLVLLAVTTKPQRAGLGRHERQLHQVGQQLTRTFQGGGNEALAEREQRLEQAHHLRAYLFRGGEGPLSGRPVPRGMERLAAHAATIGEVQQRPGRRGIWFALPLEGDFTLVAKVPPPSRLERLFNPHRLTLRLTVTFLVAGLVCYLLARSLSAPIRRLRRATQQFAGGDLSTRVRTEIRGKDEIGDLARDFDGMAERIEELLTGQKRLLRDISHELRSPLARLNVSLELARQRSGEEAQEALSRIEREAGRLNEMIGQILSLTVLEGGMEKIGKAPVDLCRLVAEVVQDADFEARGRGRSVVLQEGERVRIHGSEELLRRAIENVVRNGVRYTAEGSAVEVDLDFRQSADERRAVITVRDHGPGIPEEDLNKVFQPFYRVADARDRQSGGTGIGLAITERAVKLHGGAVTAENARGGGLRIEITLPIGPAHPA